MQPVAGKVCLCHCVYVCTTAITTVAWLHSIRSINRVQRQSERSFDGFTAKETSDFLIFKVREPTPLWIRDYLSFGIIWTYISKNRAWLSARIYSGNSGGLNFIPASFVMAFFCLLTIQSWLVERPLPIFVKTRPSVAYSTRIGAAIIETSFNNQCIFGLKLFVGSSVRWKYCLHRMEFVCCSFRCKILSGLNYVVTQSTESSPCFQSSYNISN